MRIDGAPGDHDAFDQLVRHHFHQRAVLAGARLALVGIAQNVFRFGGFLGNETPLHAGGKSRAAAPAQVGFLDFVDDLLGSQFLERAFHAFVAIVREIDFQLVRILHAEKTADDGHFGGMPFVSPNR